jgi:hypothetical protein
MNPVWLWVAADAIRRNDHRNILAGGAAGLGRSSPSAAASGSRSLPMISW